MIRINCEDLEPREVGNVDKKVFVTGGVMYLADSTSFSVGDQEENSKVPDTEVSLSFLLTLHHLTCTVLEGNSFW